MALPSRYTRAIHRRLFPPLRRLAAPFLARQLAWHLFEEKVFGITQWLGVPIWKEPADLWMYQHILTDVRPDLIIETGTLFGGSALYLGSLCDLMGKGKVITVDIKHAGPVPPHPRVTYVLGSSIDPKIVAMLHQACEGCETVLVILDSDHRYEHVIEELRLLAPLVTAGSYVIVEDTFFDYTASTDFGRGPAAAVEAFLRADSRFTPDVSRERYLITQNPGGYLRRRM